MAKFRKKPVVIDAIQFTDSDSVERMLGAWGMKFQRALNAHQGEGKLAIDTLEGVHLALVNDWIIKGVKGEFYPCKPDIFEMTYEAVANG